MGPILLWARLFFAVLFLTVTFLTLTPNPEDTETGFVVARWVAVFVLGDAELADKVAHFMAYGALGASAFSAQIDLFGKRWATPLALAAYGAALEGIQGLGGVRAPELADAIANFLGVVTAYAGAMILARAVKGSAA